MIRHLQLQPQITSKGERERGEGGEQVGWPAGRQTDKF
jgi:hypothetical protein